MSIIKNYVKEARRKEILVILDNRVFDEEGNVEEVVHIANKVGSALAAGKHHCYPSDASLPCSGCRLDTGYYDNITG